MRICDRLKKRQPLGYIAVEHGSPLEAVKAIRDAIEARAWADRDEDHDPDASAAIAVEVRALLRRGPARAEERGKDEENEPAWVKKRL